MIVRRDLAERANDKIAKILQYRTHIKEHSLYHTPPTFAVYIVGLVLEWIEARAGWPRSKSETKPRRSCSTTRLTRSGFYKCPVEQESRSKMNVVFRVAGGDEAVEKKFAKEAEAAG